MERKHHCYMFMLRLYKQLFVVIDSGIQWNLTITDTIGIQHGDQSCWKGWRVSTKSGLLLLAYNWDPENCPLYRVAGCPLFQGCLSIEVNGRTVRTFRIVCYIMGVCFSGASVKRGSTVVVYMLVDCFRCSQCILSSDITTIWTVSTQDYVQKLALASFPGSHANKQLNRKGLHFSVLQATESGESCTTKFVLLTITGTSCLLFIILMVVLMVWW